jgi:hypothetical protein
MPDFLILYVANQVSCFKWLVSVIVLGCVGTSRNLAFTLLSRVLVVFRIVTNLGLKDLVGGDVDLLSYLFYLLNLLLHLQLVFLFGHGSLFLERWFSDYERVVLIARRLKGKS